MSNNSPKNGAFEQMSEWIRIYNETEDEKDKDLAKARIVKQMIPIVNKIARTIARRSYDPIEDMVQAGFIGLLKAIDRFDYKKNDNFRVFAGYYIIGEMKHYVRDKLSVIRIPGHVQELAIRIQNFTKSLTPEELSVLTNEEVAYALNTTPASVDLAMQVERRKTPVYLEDAFSFQEALGYEELIADENESENLKYADAKIIFHDVMMKLPMEERILVEMYYKQDKSQREIAALLKLSPMSVTRRMKQAFNSMSSMIINEVEKHELDKGNT